MADARANRRRLDPRRHARRRVRVGLAQRRELVDRVAQPLPQLLVFLSQRLDLFSRHGLLRRPTLEVGVALRVELRIAAAPRTAPAARQFSSPSRRPPAAAAAAAPGPRTRRRALRRRAAPSATLIAAGGAPRRRARARDAARDARRRGMCLSVLLFVAPAALQLQIRRAVPHSVAAALHTPRLAPVFACSTREEQIGALGVPDSVGKPLVLLLATQAILFVGVGACLPALPLYGAALGLPASATGVVISTPAVALLLLSRASAASSTMSAASRRCWSAWRRSRSPTRAPRWRRGLPTLLVARLGLGAGRSLSESGERAFLSDLAQRGRSCAAARSRRSRPSPPPASPSARPSAARSSRSTARPPPSCASRPPRSPP